MNSSDINSSESVVLSKDGFNEMNLFRLKKQNASGNVRFDFLTDGNASAVALQSTIPVLKQN